MYSLQSNFVSLLLCYKDC